MMVKTLISLSLMTALASFSLLLEDFLLGLCWSGMGDSGSGVGVGGVLGHSEAVTLRELRGRRDLDLNKDGLSDALGANVMDREEDMILF
jgi:hypothetical protein